MAKRNKRDSNANADTVRFLALLQRLFPELPANYHICFVEDSGEERVFRWGLNGLEPATKVAN